VATGLSVDLCIWTVIHPSPSTWQ